MGVQHSCPNLVLPELKALELRMCGTCSVYDLIIYSAVYYNESVCYNEYCMHRHT